MKAKFLKLAGVKNEEEFYKKFPDEKSFMAKYGKQLKKAAPGISMPVNTNAFKLPTLTNTFASTPTPSFGSKVGAKAKSLASNVGKGVNEMIKPVDLSTPGGVAGIVGGIGAGINTIKQTKKNIAELEKYGKVSDVVLQATNIKPERVQNRYLRPEDNLVQNMNPLGTGTNYLAARNGAEIQNTYAPDVMYTDLGYEPLNDSNKMKQYKKGGKMKKAAAGAFLDIANSAADIAKQSGQLGGGLGSQIGGAGGETGGYTQMLGSLGGLGGLIGGLLDAPMLKKKQQAQSYLDKNTGLISGANDMNDFFQERDAFAKNGKKISSYEDGGWVSNDWQPQVITSFGEHSMEDLLAPDPMMDTLRAGGHLSYYTPPSERAMSTERAENGIQMAMGGDLQVHRGKAEPISYNPFLPNNGETVMFKGPSHDDGGMPISYGQNGVEVEGGEPAMVMKDGGKMNGDGKDTLLVFGNLINPLTNKKFKNDAAAISKKESKQNKIVDRSMALANIADENYKFGTLLLNSAMASNLGAKMSLKELAMEKTDLANRQTSILDTAEEFGIKPEDIEYAKFGGKFDFSESFNNGGKKSKVPSSPFTKKGKAALKSKILIPSNIFTPEGNDFLKQVEKEQDQAMGLNRYYPSGLEKPMKQQVYNNPPAAYNVGPMFNDALSPEAQGKGYISNLDEQIVAANSNKPKSEGSSQNWSNLANIAYSSIYPFIRPTSARPLDPNQLAPEYLSRAMNQIQPVQAQTITPYLLPNAPTYSFQDQLNEITAQTRDAMRMAQGDPSALARIASEAYSARNKVIGEETKINQTEKQRILEQNTNTLNDVEQKNLAILDQAYVRGLQGKSNTDATNRAIANSIAAKYAQNKLENMEMTARENLFPKFNFTEEGRIYKDPLAFTNFGPGMGTGSSGQGDVTGGMTVGGKRFLPTNYDDQGNPTHYKIVGSKSNDTPLVKNGGIVKAFKKL